MITILLLSLSFVASASDSKVSPSVAKHQCKFLFERRLDADFLFRPESAEIKIGKDICKYSVQNLVSSSERTLSVSALLIPRQCSRVFGNLPVTVGFRLEGEKVAATNIMVNDQFYSCK